MLFLSKKYMSVYLSILLMSGCANTGKMNFENIMDNRVTIDIPSIKKLVFIEGKDFINKTKIMYYGIRIERYHFKLHGNPKLAPCFYYYYVDSKTQRLIGWGYDDKGDKRACVN